MTNVEFNDENAPVSAYNSPKSPGLIVLVQKWGLAKDDKQAEQILIGIAVVGILITLITMCTLLFNANPKKPPVRSVTGAPITSTP